MRSRTTRLRRGFSLVGLMVTLVCMLVLSVILMNSMSKSVTGSGSTQSGSAFSMMDSMVLQSVMTSMLAHNMDIGGESQYLVPSELSGSGDVAQNTSANLWSAMIMQRWVDPKSLISKNDRQAFVEVDTDYDWGAYDPRNGQYWDPTFSADLSEVSNVSWAHMPLSGDRLKRNWKATLDGRFPLIGSRGPKDGIDDPFSLTYGGDGSWAGHVAFGDGHVEFVDSFTPGCASYRSGGQIHQGNLFRLDDGPLGGDPMLGFTQRMTPDGPVLQWD